MLNRNIMYAALLFLVIAVIIAAGYDKTKTPINTLLGDAEARIAAGQWPQAKASLAGVQATWKRQKFWISLVNSVQNVEAFDLALSQATASVDMHDKGGAAQQVARLKRVWQDSH